LLKEFNSDDAQGDLNRIQSAWGTKVPAELLAIAGLELYTVVDSLPDDSYYRGSLNVMLEDVDGLVDAPSQIEEWDLPKNLMPFTVMDHFGFCFDFGQDKSLTRDIKTVPIVLYDCDKEASYPVADNFDEFLTLLEDEELSDDDAGVVPNANGSDDDDDDDDDDNDDGSADDDDDDDNDEDTALLLAGWNEEDDEDDEDDDDDDEDDEDDDDDDNDDDDDDNDDDDDDDDQDDDDDALEAEQGLNALKRSHDQLDDGDDDDDDDDDDDNDDDDDVVVADTKKQKL